MSGGVSDGIVSLRDLLARSREYVADALEAHEHSDGRALLSEIDAALLDNTGEARDGLSEALLIARAEKDRWLKAANKHIRANGRRSDCRDQDLERARIAHRIEDAIAAKIASAPTLADLILATPSTTPEKAGEDAPVAWRCDGCDRVTGDPAADLAELKAAGKISCCPERRMKPFAPTQQAVVSEGMVGALFRRKQLVKHLKTGGVYRIVHTPATCRLEASNGPAYAYQQVAYLSEGAALCDVSNAPLWVRGQAEMEDGRFAALAGDRP